MKYSFVYFWIAICCFGQQQASDGVKARLERSVPDTNQSDLSIRSAFVHALSVAGLPGGLEVRETCDATGVNPSPPKGSDVRAFLDEIVSVRPDLSMKIGDDGLVLLNSRHQQDALLGLRLERVDIPDIQDLVRTVDSLIHARETQAEIIRLGLKERPGRIGFSIIPKPGYPARKPVALTLTDVTLREALNVIAKRHGKAVWVYAETACGNEQTFSLPFDVR